MSTEKKENSNNFEYGTLDYFRVRIVELIAQKNTAQEESDYYRGELAKSHEILGRVIHQLSERWNSVNLTKFYPTDNLWRQRKLSNPSGKK